MENELGNKKRKVDMVAEGKRSLTDAIRVRFFTRHSGGNYEQLRREVSNGYFSRSHEHPSEVVEAYRQMEHYHPVFNNRRKEGDKGSQYLLDGGGGENQIRPAHHRFKCDRIKKKCYGTRF